MPLVGVESCVYRILGSGILRTAFITSVYVRGKAVFLCPSIVTGPPLFYVPQLLQVRRCSMSLSCYRSDVVLCPSVVTAPSLFYVPPLLQVRRCCAYDRAVLVLCMPIAGY